MPARKKKVRSPKVAVATINNNIFEIVQKQLETIEKKNECLTCKGKKFVINSKTGRRNKCKACNATGLLNLPATNTPKPRRKKVKARKARYA